MIAYLDSSALGRRYLVDEGEHGIAQTLLDNPEVTTISGSWTRIEVTGALVRAARAGRGGLDDLLARFERDQSSQDGPLVLVDVEQADVESLALAIVRRSGIRSMDAWHLACASIAIDSLADPGEERAFVTRDAEQEVEARALGFTVL
jgi:predicted nucleic acid-binding protein